MFRKNIILAIRFLLKYKTYTVLNFTGLTIGFFCALVIIFWIDLNVSTDRFHENGKNIYKLYKQGQFGDDQMSALPALPGPLAAALTREVPEIRDAIRITWGSRLQFTRGENSFFEHGFYADSSFFRVFSFSLLYGDPASVLNDPGSIAISERMAIKYFGRTNVTGESLLTENQELSVITGVFKDVPANSSFKFDFILPFSKYYRKNKSFVDMWDNSDLMTFIQTCDGVNQKVLSDKMTRVIHKHFADAAKYKIRIDAQPLEKMHLYSDFKSSSSKSSGLIVMVRIMGLVAAFIILLACFNYINMATALYSRRSKEVGLQVIFGSGRKSMIPRFITEAIVLTVIAFVFAFIFVSLSIPLMNRILHENLSAVIDSTVIKTIVIFLPLFTGVLAGLIPALRLSSLKPLAAIKSSGNQVQGRFHLRTTLIIIQYIITISFIFFSLTVFRQLNYIRNKDLGLKAENVIFFKIPDEMFPHREAFKSEIKRIPGVESVSYVFKNPLEVNSTLICTGKDPDKDIVAAYMVGDNDFVTTMDMELLEGDNHSGYTEDNTTAFINQELAASMGYEDPLGQNIQFMGSSVIIAGVIKNFHFSSLRVPVGRLLILRGLEGTDMMLVRLKSDSFSEAISVIGEKYHDFQNDKIFEYSFMDDVIESHYRSDYSMKTLVNLFTLVSIIISCSGLFGFALFTTEQRTKEIGTRKAFGAKSSGIIMMLIYSFFKPIIVSFVISGIISYNILNKWLQGFAYHIKMNPGMFLSAAFCTILFSLLTIIWKCWRTANTNPIDALKYE